ncbi:MAG TPA: tetratricopeptide repeat protein [Planctomycetaceae bacterium]|jgi:tetratricopeptide (TPR) repeat protein
MATPAEPTPPTPQQIKIAADCWRRANEAVPKENWDYAIQMYGQSVKLVPDNLTYRQSLRFTEYKKYDMNMKGAAMSSMKLMGPRGRIKKCRMGKDWKGVAEAAEDGLAINPWDPQLGADLGDALKELGYQEVAKFAYEESLKVDGSNVGVNRNLALLYEERSQYAEAVKCWQRVLKVEPTSGEARSKITALDAKTVMDRGGYEGAANTRSVMADHEKARRQGAKGTADGPGMSVEADLQRAIRKEPANKDHYTKLADYYKREGKLEEAEEQLQKALEVSGNEVGVREMLEDVQLDLMFRALTIAKEQARNTPADPELKKRAAELANELTKRKMEVYAGRVERYPNDMRMKFELGGEYMTVRKWQLAIPLFQQARSDPRLKGESLIRLGKCFGYDGKPQLAIRQFEAAMPEIKFDDKPDIYKDMYFTAAKLYEELKNPKAAEEAYQKVLEVDYTYRDTIDRLNKLQGGSVAPPMDE